MTLGGTVTIENTVASGHTVSRGRAVASGHTGVHDPADDARGQLVDRLGFQLYASSRAIMGAYRRELAAFGLTYPQYLTMNAVWAAEGQTVSQLCAALELETGTVSPILVRLEALGYVLRERAGTDGRQVRVFCTEQGAELRARLLFVPGCVEAAAGLSEADYGQLFALLGALRAAVRVA